MLKTVLAGAAIGIAISLGAATAQAATGDFVCPAITGGAGQVDAKTVQALLGTGDPLDKPDQLDAAVDALRKAGANRAIIIDNLVSAYCPTVAANKSLTNYQKNVRVQRFASIVTQRVFNLANEEAVLLDVALPPSMFDAINARAKAAGVSAQEWVAGVVAQSLGANQ